MRLGINPARLIFEENHESQGVCNLGGLFAVALAEAKAKLRRRRQINPAEYKGADYSIISPLRCSGFIYPLLLALAKAKSSLAQPQSFFVKND